MSRRMRRRRSARQSFAVGGIYVWLNVFKSLWDAAVPNVWSWKNSRWRLGLHEWPCSEPPA